MTLDEYSNHAVAAITPGTTILDTQGFNALTYVFSYGATSVVSLEDGDDPALADGAAVDPKWILGNTTFTASGVGLVGYVGTKRYVKFSETNPVANTSVYAFEGFLGKAPKGVYPI